MDRVGGRWAAVPLALVLAASSVTLPRVSAADEPSDHHDRAQAAYRESLDLYKSGRYRDAVQRLEEARALDPTAKELPYNLGLVHEKLGDIDDAIKYFKMYVAMETDAGERDRVQAIIKRLEGARDDLVKATPAASASSSASAPPPPPPDAKRGRLDQWTYIAGGATVVLAGVGAGFGIAALGKRPSNPTTAPGGKTIADLDADARSAHSSAVDADIFFGLAVAGGAATALLYLLRDEKKSDAPATSWTPVIAPRRGGLSTGLGVSF